MNIIKKTLLSTALIASFSANSSATIYTVASCDGMLTQIRNGSTVPNGTEVWSTGNNEYVMVSKQAGSSGYGGMSTRLPLSKNHAYLVQGSNLTKEAILSTRSLNAINLPSSVAGVSSRACGGVGGISSGAGGVSNVGGGLGGSKLLTIAGLAAAIAAAALIASDDDDNS